MEYKGYILLHRKILENSCWNNGQKYDIRSAWIYILLIVNHADKEQLYNGQIITIHRGQKLTSMVKLAKIWGVDRKTVKKWLIIWKNAGMIRFDITNQSTLLTVVNYSQYQDFKSFNKRGMDNKVDNGVDNDMDKGMDKGMVNGVAQTKNVKECIKNDKELKERDFNNLPIEPPTGGGEWQ